MLKITISGPAKSGKTTLAQALREFLGERGAATVKVDDPDIAFRDKELNDRCLQTICQRGEFLIETVQTNVR